MNPEGMIEEVLFTDEFGNAIGKLTETLNLAGDGIKEYAEKVKGTIYVSLKFDLKPLNQFTRDKLLGRTTNNSRKFHGKPMRRRK